MITSHILGFPRIGANREYKKCIEAYWKGAINEETLNGELLQIKQSIWKTEAENGLDYITVGDFSSYDHILDLSVALGVIPERYGTGSEGSCDLMFRMARGRAPKGSETAACEMTKWFDTNYHYIVPEFYPDTEFKLNADYLTEQVAAAKKYGKVKFVIPGALTFLKLGKERGDCRDRLDLLPKLKSVYQSLINEIIRAGANLIQIDEPILVLDLPQNWRDAFDAFYRDIHFDNTPALLATYFDEVNYDLQQLFKLPFNIFHFDFVKNPAAIDRIVSVLPDDKSLSAGIINGRNIWKADLEKMIRLLRPCAQKLNNRLMISASCSLLHVPVDLDNETIPNPEIKRWLSFAVQKLKEIDCIKSALNNQASAYESYLKENAADIAHRRTSPLIHNAEVQDKLAAIRPDMIKRGKTFLDRKAIQTDKHNLPLFPTTTIGSFPQTTQIRKIRRDFKAGNLSQAEYIKQLKAEIQNSVNIQEEIGLDVLVHGEPERNDMVEYFGEQLSGFTFTKNAWVQSYGTRCVKPPLIYGDISRQQAMTVEWSTYAQTLTKKPMKGMLTGPVTILQWSFVRDDQPRDKTCFQIALALREEVSDLEKAGIAMIQVDEPALREGLPLHKRDWDAYLKWATEAFRLSTSAVKDETQIHTHMCYCEFNEIMPSITSLDADVISIETSRSHMDLLDAFKDYKYPNDIGPGVYDIHSPRVPAQSEMTHLLEKAAELIPSRQLWVNPDCGLKTRDWSETKQALLNMVSAAREMRQRH